MDLYGRLLADVLFPGFEVARGRPTLGLIRFLERTQWASADELHALQSGLLRRLVRHAYRHTAHYRQIFDQRGLTPDDIRTPADLVKLPLLEKDDARGSIEARTSDAPPFAVVHKATSGSTGQPMVVSYNAESRHYRDATRWRAYGWAGYRMGKRALHYWGFGAAPPASRWGRIKVQLDHLLKRDSYIDCSPRGDDHLAGVVEEIKRHRPEVIVTYSQAGAALARYVQRTDSRTWGNIPVLCGAERVFDHDRAALMDVFGPDVFETYGAREFMLMASECEAHDGLHTSMETMIVEVVVREPGGVVRPAGPGESGEVVVTDLHNLAVPFLRYVNSDLAVQRSTDPCACGRLLHRIGPIDGRVTETLRDGKGDPVNGLIFSILFVALAAETREFQAVQHLDRSLTLKIVPSATGALPAATTQVIDQFCARYLPGIRVKVDLVDDIPPGAAGKRRLVIVERPA